MSCCFKVLKAHRWEAETLIQPCRATWLHTLTPGVFYFFKYCCWGLLPASLNLFLLEPKRNYCGIKKPSFFPDDVTAQPGTERLHHLWAFPNAALLRMPVMSLGFPSTWHFPPISVLFKYRDKIVTKNMCFIRTSLDIHHCVIAYHLLGMRRASYLWTPCAWHLVWA